MNHIYQKEFYQTLKGVEILKCIQCGTCSASCPLASQMDYTPRQLFALIRDNEMEIALRSNTPWLCVSCYQCMVRCPQEIPITNLMYGLKQMSVQYDMIPRSHQKPMVIELYRAFADEVEKHKRVNEMRMMLKYGLHHPLNMLENFHTGMILFIKHRLKLS